MKKESNEDKENMKDQDKADEAIKEAIQQEVDDRDKKEQNESNDLKDDGNKDDCSDAVVLLKRVQADFENYMKRTENEKLKFMEYSCQEFVKDLLPVLDSFELAIKNSDHEDIKAIYGQLWQLLSSKGLEKISSMGEKFDPYLHEALLQEKSEKEEGIVLEELQPGYRFKDIVIRPAKVKVSKR